ncbi:acetyl-CoA carboxylase biotin carboxylase subunit [Clostridium bornimense]|uniref:acetyl-CoA carboxylase biotin carboxylase subunit n=1 Tax=Clostridium bornimense TaxID=1216932 RepID=UPI001C120993|nr:acetyl-CoA carboxylase biotin carboxylase subunit [Clostridium bornimense]MBU5316401.1 acetyl-CoA carboxylase biotin carboxylase subunit [Clostridium bornimense]
MKTKNIKKVLIANRGEIAVRIIRACKELGIKTVAVYSEADKDSLHIKLADESICIGEAYAKDSYLNIPNIISACEIMDVQAVHPGYGFLSENAEFAKICEDCNIIYIGPSSYMVGAMGDKIRAKEIMKNAGVPVIPGSDGGVLNVERALSVANKIGYPVIIKAALGGGGKGIRVVSSDEELKKQYYICKLEAKKCFQSEEVYIEKFVEKAKHIEFQIIADNYGDVIYLPERDCSMQRNNQKILEESPSTVITEELRNKIGNTVVEAIKKIGYRSVGTIEFLLDKDYNYYFLEMNTRIQVEHSISEDISNIDILKEQIKIADGEKLEIKQENVILSGHSIECRINAEDAFNDFRPCPGKIDNIIFPGGIGIRIDTNVYNGYTIPMYYDSMILKLIVHGNSREETIERTKRALDEIKIEGIKTNIDFHKWIFSKEAFLEGSYCTDYLEDELVNKDGFIK